MSFLRRGRPQRETNAVRADSNIHRIHGTGSLPQYEHDGDDYDQWYLAVRALMRLIADRHQDQSAFAIVPGTQLDNSFLFLQQLFQDTVLVSENMLYRTPGDEYLLWQEVAKNLDDFVDWMQEKNILHGLIALLAYASSPDYWQVYDALLARGVRSDSNMDRLQHNDYFDRGHFVHKGAYYPWLDGSQDARDVRRFAGIPMARGVVACTADEILEHRAHLQSLFGNGTVVLKQIFAGGGYGINFFDSISALISAVQNGEYTFEGHPYDSELTHPVLIQEALQIQRDSWGEVGLSVQFSGQNILATTRTLSSGQYWQGNILVNSGNFQGSGLSQKNIKNAEYLARKILAQVQPQGRGGIDFVVAKDQRGVSSVQFMELNGARTTGAEEAVQLARIFANNEQVRNPVVTGVHKYSIPEDAGWTIDQVAEHLCSQKMLLDPANPRPNGLFPLACFGDHLTLLGASENPEALLGMFALVQEGGRR